ncbi:MAG: cupin domain-containing protein [Syntrophomonadaceae bacterium]
MNRKNVYKASNSGYLEAIEGILRKTLVFGENSLLTEFILKKGKILPRHQHPQEQVGYLVSGHIILHIGQEKYDILPGDSWAILGNVEHSADILEDSVAIEIFSPVREDYLP